MSGYKAKFICELLMTVFQGKGCGVPPIPLNKQVTNVLRPIAATQLPWWMIYAAISVSHLIYDGLNIVCYWPSSGSSEPSVGSMPYCLLTRGLHFHHNPPLWQPASIPGCCLLVCTFPELGLGKLSISKELWRTLANTLYWKVILFFFFLEQLP